MEVSSDLFVKAVSQLPQENSLVPPGWARKIRPIVYRFYCTSRSKASSKLSVFSSSRFPFAADFFILVLSSHDQHTGHDWPRKEEHNFRFRDFRFLLRNTVVKGLVIPIQINTTATAAKNLAMNIITKSNIIKKAENPNALC